ncbi:MAG: glycosyltransferase family 39 protein [Deltaproteobacteria bacterium]|nr:glycosyltransferase family 39 protein [Deltaproteobacteria bacterium]
MENDLPTSYPPAMADDGIQERWSFLLVVGVAAGVLLPLLGAVGYFDPWETHYAEVARQMAVRDDYLYPFWKDSYFFSKPVLLFWLTAPFYKLIGAADPEGPMPALAELVGRLPSALSSIFCVAVVYWAARRLWGRRAAVLSSLALATMPLWAFLSRQAITDMLYAAPASAALLLLAVALFDDDRPTEGERLPRWFVVLCGVCLVPQAWEIGRSAQFLNRVEVLGSEAATRLATSVALAVGAVALLIWLARTARDPLLHGAALLFALSTLAKGPIGVVLCGGALVIAVILLGEWQRLARPAAVTSTVLFLAVSAPWPLVMSVFPGLDEGRKTWVQRFVLYDLLGRGGGAAHGDKGSFDYYLRYLGWGLFPWSALLPFALVDALRDRARTPAGRFTLLVAVWAVLTFVFFTATVTKFHHYMFPLCVPAALLLGRWLDALCDDERVLSPLLALLAIALLVLMGRDLVMEPWQLIDLFTYHYKGYKPDYYFPSDLQWRVGLGVACFGAALLLGVGAIAGAARGGHAPHWSRRPWWVTALVGDARANAPFVLGAVAAALAFSLFAVQVHFNRASQHWSQRWMFQTYEALKGPNEPIIAYQMDWKGEAFYAKNRDLQVKKNAADLKKLIERPGREFVLVQTDRFGGMKTALGKEYEDKIRVVDRTNQKWYLVTVDDK